MFCLDSGFTTIEKRLLDISVRKGVYSNSYEHFCSALSLKSKIEASSYSVHDILTMASIVEKEAVHVEDRAKVAQVIYTRMDLGMNLGMDVTTYYGVRKDMTETLTAVDLNDENPYNTRVATFLGLPVGPICNPAISSIESVLNPADTDYIYFYADIITGNVYFTNSYDEFLEFRKIYG